MGPSRRERRRAAIERQVERLSRRIAALEATSNRFTWLRLLVFIAGFLVSAFVFFLRGPLLWLAVLAFWLIPFAVVVAVHRRLEQGIRRHRIWRARQQRQRARMALAWDSLADVPTVPPPPGHPFALDLDLLGPRSLHQLLDTAVARDGSLRLQKWLLDPAPAAEAIARRQALVRELRPLSRFRAKLHLHARLAAGEEEEPWEATRLLHWMEQPAPAGSLRLLVVLLILLAVSTALLFSGEQIGALPRLWPFTFALYAILYLSLGRAASSVFGEALALQAALDQVRQVFRFLEDARYGQNPHLRALCAPFLQAETRPSAMVRRLNRVVNAAGLSQNPVLALVINAVFPWDLFFAYRLHRLRGQLAGRLATWLDVWFELEALSSLANFGYLNPRNTFPAITGNEESAENLPPFSGRALGHPLIPEVEKVRNDFTIPALGQIDIITGSNMAGKSSFLRTLGVNLCLAYAGGPVDADHLETRLFRLFTCIRVTDSVTDGISYFYAEVQRLKALLNALKAEDERPLFYLIDEIFRGTNNRERLIGSRAYIRELAGRDGVGVIATHDLELVHLAEEIPAVRNYHFRDAIAGGRMVFDYRLRPGPSPTTNALKIMRSEGLPVDEEGG